MSSFLKSKMPLVYLVTSLNRSGVWLGVVELFSSFEIASCRDIPVRLFSSYDYNLERDINGEGFLSRECVLVVSRKF